MEALIPFLLLFLIALIPIALMAMILFGDGSALHKILWIVLIWVLSCIGIIMYFILKEETKTLGEKW